MRVLWLILFNSIFNYKNDSNLFSRGGVRDDLCFISGIFYNVGVMVYIEFYMSSYIVLYYIYD